MATGLGSQAAQDTGVRSGSANEPCPRSFSFLSCFTHLFKLLDMCGVLVNVCCMSGSRTVQSPLAGLLQCSTPAAWTAPHIRPLSMQLAVIREVVCLLATLLTSFFPLPHLHMPGSVPLSPPPHSVQLDRTTVSLAAAVAGIGTLNEQQLREAALEWRAAQPAEGTVRTLLVLLQLLTLVRYYDQAQPDIAQRTYSRRERYNARTRLRAYVS